MMLLSGIFSLKPNTTYTPPEPDPTPKTKTCICCYKNRPIEQFRYDKTNIDKHSAVCRWCFAQNEMPYKS